MIYLLHGDDTSQSREFLQSLTDGVNSLTLDGKNLSLATFEENAISKSLFEDAKLLVIENLFTKNLKKKEFVNFLNTNNTTSIIVFWEDKKALKTSFSSLKNANVKEFTLPSFYFQFLDSLTPINKVKAFALYHNLLVSYAPEQILFSLIKRIRQLVVISSGERTEDIKKMSNWQLDRLVSQSRGWKKGRLIEFYNSLLEAEINLKSGKLPVSLSKHLDILLLTKLL